MIKSWMRSVLFSVIRPYFGAIIFMGSSFFKVDAFLEAHDSGLTDDDKKVADGKLCASLTGLIMLNCEIDLLHAEPLK